MQARQLIALDRGTSMLRASLLGAGGVHLDERSTAAGVMAVPDRQFNAALVALCGDWLRAHPVSLLASGMIGSQQGCAAAPYLDCPAGPAAAAATLTRITVSLGIESAARKLHIVPGLRCADGSAVASGGRCLLPGTHSKWAWLGDDGRVVRLATYMTGKIYAVLTQHCILGRLMQFGVDSPADFAAGVQRGLAHSAQATHAVFAARTDGLTG